jgi:uncharacterized protein
MQRAGERTGRTALAAVVLVALLAAAGAWSPLAAAPKFPALTGRVVDDANLLTAADRSELTQELAALEAKSTDQLVVYTTKSLQGYPIEEFGYLLGRAWQIGQKDKDNGVLLIVAPNERKVRIEVGRGLEPQLTDLMTKLIIENAILPAFRRGDFPAGIKAGVHDIRDVMLGDAEAVKERARTAKKRSGGEADWFTLVFFAMIIGAFLLVWLQARQTAHPSRASQSRYRRRGYDPIVIPGSWGGWSGGGWGGGSGGGGFSGGGGGFGGGGSSGSW